MRTAPPCRCGSFDSGALGLAEPITPSSIAVKASGDVFVADVYNSVNLHLNASGSVVQVWQHTTVLDLDRIYQYDPDRFRYSLLLDSDNQTLWAANELSAQLEKYNSSTGQLLANYSLSSANLLSPITLATLPNGNLITTGPDMNSIAVFDPHSGALVSSITSNVTYLIGAVATDSAGFVYAASLADEVVYKLNPTTGQVVQTFDSSGSSFGSLQMFTPGYESCFGLAVLGNGDVIVSDFFNMRLLRFAANGTVLQEYGASTYYLYPCGVAVLNSEQIVVSDQGTLSMVVFNLVDGSAAFTFNVPYTYEFFCSGVAVSESLIVVANMIRYTIHAFALNGTWLFDLQQPADSLVYPLAVAVSSSGDVFALDNQAVRIVVWRNSSGSASPPLSLSSSAPAATVSSTGGAGPTGVSSSLCVLLYSLPGTVDYPWSVSLSLSFVYDSTPVNTVWGTAVTLRSGSGTRTFTNRFGVSTTTTLTSAAPAGNRSADQLLYLGNAFPVDSYGLTWTLSSPTQLPGANPLQQYSSITLVNASGVIIEAGESRVDPLGEAFFSPFAGFVNTSIAASNINSLAANHSGCQASITFTNGLRQPTQPSVSNGGAHIRFQYSITDGTSYISSANLTLTTTSAFASIADRLGNPHQTVVNITGTRTYTYFPTNQTLTSVVTGLHANSSIPQRFYPYALLSALPGVYTSNTAPFLDAAGLQFSLSNAVPVDGAAPGTGAQSSTVTIAISGYESGALLMEMPFSSLPSGVLQQQTYSFM